MGGGILADDMGMGKSLSTLALITTTLDEALSWSQTAATKSRKRRSRGTLIIVPSTREPDPRLLSLRSSEQLSDIVVIMNSWLKEIETYAFLCGSQILNFN